ncbi:hypothetical protein [Thermomonospora cellulosilytica]|uniref:Ketosteroid isomerase-like protein n=1 Tax=Thermomonospora cellulosilytica TaxID=1411118 RepID=A0A7W3MYC5_9ACTN|nr:hypothetical protein [Thermomonospora cellulosilytica]MBA9004087.1 ketosteroid isomerase-like protein [Thermomonospora cellulosilytica]
MFVQVIQGRTNDPAGLRQSLDRWMRDLSPHAVGWLGSTFGVTGDNTFIGIARFESPEAARRNSEGHEQGQWFAETSKFFEGEVTFHDCTDVELIARGGSDDAGFVQIIQQRIRDREALRDFWTEARERAMMELRPDIIGGVFAVHPDGGCTTVLYFTSEEAAREGERKEMPPEIKAQWEKEMQYYEGEPVFYDLREPWLYSPSS